MKVDGVRDVPGEEHAVADCSRVRAQRLDRLYIYIDRYMYMCIHVYIHTYMYINLSIYLSIYLSIHIYVYLYMYEYTYI